MLIGHNRFLSLCRRQYMNLRTATCATYATGLSLPLDTVTVLGAMLKLFNSCYLNYFLPFLCHLRVKYEYNLQHVF